MWLIDAANHKRKSDEPSTSCILKHSLPGTKSIFRYATGQLPYALSADAADNRFELEP